MTRHLNIWVGADQAVFDLAYWDRCAAPAMRMEEFRRPPRFMGLDMATRIDIAAASLVFPYQDEGDSQVRYAVFHMAWLPQAAVDPNRNPAYVQWVEQGHLTVTEGETTDYSAVEDAIRASAPASTCDWWPMTPVATSRRSGCSTRATR